MSNGQEPGRELATEAAATPSPLEIQLDSSKAESRLISVAQVIKGCTKHSILRTNTTDWVKMGKGYYLQASGAQKIRSLWGIYFRDRQVIKEVHEDGTYSYIVSGVVGSKLLDQLYGEVTIDIEGGRSSDDPFFARQGKVDPLDIRKAAVANWEARAVTALLGLKNFTDKDLAANGINVGEVTTVEYQGGAEGGGRVGVISEGQRKRLYAIQQSSKVDAELVKALLKAYGFNSSTDITRDRYQEICEVVETGTECVQVRLHELQATAQPPANP